MTISLCNVWVSLSAANIFRFQKPGLFDIIQDRRDRFIEAHFLGVEHKIGGLRFLKGGGNPGIIFDYAPVRAFLYNPLGSLLTHSSRGHLT